MIAILTALATLSLASMPVGAVGNSPRTQNLSTIRAAAHVKHPAHAEPSCGTFFNNDDLGGLLAPGLASVYGTGIGLGTQTVSKFHPYYPGDVDQTCYFGFTGQDPNFVPVNEAVYWGGVTAHYWNVMVKYPNFAEGCEGGGCTFTESPLTFGPGIQGVLVTTATAGVYGVSSPSPYANTYGEMVRKHDSVFVILLWPVASPSTITALVKQFLVSHPSF
jgi:hypothetical protein